MLHDRLGKGDRPPQGDVDAHLVDRRDEVDDCAIGHVQRELGDRRPAVAPLNNAAGCPGRLRREIYTSRDHRQPMVGAEIFDGPTGNNVVVPTSFGGDALSDPGSTVLAMVSSDQVHKAHRYRVHCHWSGSTGSGYEAFSRVHSAAAPPAEVRLELSGDPAFGGDSVFLNP